MDNALPKHIIPIPEEFRKPFEDDPIIASQSYLCWPQESSSPYFEDRSAIRNMIDRDRPNPLSLDLEFDPLWYCSNDDDNYRFMHIDLGHTHDSCGISMCHVSDWRKVKVRSLNNETNEVEYSLDYRPVITFDFLCRIVPEKGSEIIFENIRKIIYEVDRRGFPILLITFDRFQSTDMIQILRRGTEEIPGFICANLSLDKTSTYPVVDISKDNNYRKESTGVGKYSTLAAWSTGKTAINNERIHLPSYWPVSDNEIWDYDYYKGSVDDFGVRMDKQTITWIEQEAFGATFDSKTLHVREPPRGTIDLLESVIGSIYNATNNVTTYEIEETEFQKKKRLAKRLSSAETIFDKEDIKMAIGDKDNEEIPLEKKDPLDRSIFDEGESIDNQPFFY